MDYPYSQTDCLSDGDILRAFAIVLPYLNDLSRDDTAFVLSDTEKYIYNQPAGNFDLKVKQGTELAKLAKDCLRSGGIVKGDMISTASGKPIKTISVPIRNSEGHIVGIIGCAIDMGDSSLLLKSIDEISLSVQQVSDSVEQIASAAVELAESGQKSLGLAQETMEATQKTSRTLEVIKGITDKINLLGLNAAIESARAGEQGKGFSVVSSEITKLAHQSKESTLSIRNVMEDMKKSVNSITSSVDDSACVSEELSASIEEISATIEIINVNLQKLSIFSKRFV